MLLPKLAVWCATLGGVAPALAQGHVPVTGVKVAPGRPVPLRQNINQVEAQGGPTWDLLIRAMRAMYSMDPVDQRSYFQIAGIHGRPYVEWNSAGPKRATEWEGYCPHGEKIFASWHRPYLALYEQELVRHAQALAQQYPPRYRAQYVQAASNLRIPYWDWGAQQAVPQVTVPGRVRVNEPNGQALRSVEVDNPFATFKYPPAARAGRFGPWDPQPQIVRCVAPNSYPASANRNLQGRTYRQWVYDAFTRSTTFDQFVTASDTNIGLEGIHNSIHWDGACGSQFLEVDYTAYDPLFMLHHCNVDRLLAYWEAMHPESSIFNGSYLGLSRYSTRENTRITPDSPLEPFFQENGAFHTSRGVDGGIRRFGYTYQGLEFWQKSAAQMKLDARRLINQLYAPRRTASVASKLDAKETQTRFFVSVRLDISQVERPCAVGIYLAGKEAGHLVFLQKPASGVKTAAFAIDDALQGAGMKDLPLDRALKSIQSSLAIGIVKSDGGTIPLSSVPSLNVTLENVHWSPASSEDALPQFGASKRRDVPVTDHSKGASP